MSNEIRAVDAKVSENLFCEIICRGLKSRVLNCCFLFEFGAVI